MYTRCLRYNGSRDRPSKKSGGARTCSARAFGVFRCQLVRDLNTWNTPSATVSSMSFLIVKSSAIHRVEIRCLNIVNFGVLIEH